MCLIKRSKMSKSKKKKKKKDKYDPKFKLGDTIVFEPKNFNPDYWDSLSEEDRIKYYGPLGYGSEKLVTWTFITEMYPQNGHIVIMRINDGKIEMMRHIQDFRLAIEDKEV